MKVTSNDPVNPEIRLKISAFLEVYLSAKPTRLYFGRIHDKAPISKTISLTGTEVKSVKINEIALKNNNLKDVISWEIKDKRDQSPPQLVIDVTLVTEKMKPGDFEDTLLIKTDLAKVGVLDVNLKGIIEGPLAATPQRMYFGNYETGFDMTKVLTITNKQNKPFKILSVDISAPEFSVKEIPQKAAITHELEIVLAKGATQSRLKGDILLKTDVPDQPEVTVPIHAYKRRVREDKPKHDRKMPKAKRLPSKTKSDMKAATTK